MMKPILFFLIQNNNYISLAGMYKLFAEINISHAEMDNSAREMKVICLINKSFMKLTKITSISWNVLKGPSRQFSVFFRCILQLWFV